MIQLDIGDNTCQRDDDVGRVQAAAQSRFPDHDIAMLLGKVAQSHHGHDFEESRMRVGRKRREQRMHLRYQTRHVGFQYWAAIDLDTLSERD